MQIAGADHQPPIGMRNSCIAQITPRASHTTTHDRTSKTATQGPGGPATRWPRRPLAALAPDGRESLASPGPGGRGGGVSGEVGSGEGAAERGGERAGAAGAAPSQSPRNRMTAGSTKGKGAKAVFWDVRPARAPFGDGLGRGPFVSGVFEAPGREACQGCPLQGRSRSLGVLGQPLGGPEFAELAQGATTPKRRTYPCGFALGQHGAWILFVVLAPFLLSIRDEGRVPV